jgi:hypothetical protein
VARVGRCWGMRLIHPALDNSRPGISTRCGVFSLGVFSEPISLLATMAESGSWPADSTLKPFPSFLPTLIKRTLTPWMIAPFLEELQL